MQTKPADPRLIMFPMRSDADRSGFLRMIWVHIRMGIDCHTVEISAFVLLVCLVI